MSIETSRFALADSLRICALRSGPLAGPWSASACFRLPSSTPSSINRFPETCRKSGKAPSSMAAFAMLIAANWITGDLEPL